ncbi:MAG TPA: hypothetical protein VMR73_00520 [Candidatus Paceibacterota bacterium]|nr:hypothetical protein [Candidatus Paceibacterota bacterium]
MDTFKEVRLSFAALFDLLSGMVDAEMALLRKRKRLIAATRKKSILTVIIWVTRRKYHHEVGGGLWRTEAFKISRRVTDVKSLDKLIAGCAKGFSKMYPNRYTAAQFTIKAILPKGGELNLVYEFGKKFERKICGIVLSYNDPKRTTYA